MYYYWGYFERALSLLVTFRGLVLLLWVVSKITIACVVVVMVGSCLA